MFNNPFLENLVIYEIMWKNVVQHRHTTDDSMAHAHCLLDI